MKEVKKKHFFNYDETSYNIINPPKTAIRIKGASSIKINVNNNLRTNITIGLTESLG